MTTRSKLGSRDEIPPTPKLTFMEAIAEVKAIQREVLARRNGVPIDINAILDEVRGYAPNHDRPMIR